MIKTQGFRKFATTMAVIFGMTMFLAACGTDSSLDQALSQPGDNFIGTLRFDADPANGSLTITPVASALSNTQVSIKDGFSVTSSKPSDGTPGADWAGGILSANLTVTNKSTAYKLENASLRIFNSTDMTITTQATTTDMGIPGNDVIACNQAGPLSTKLANGGCLAAGGPGITIVGDYGTNNYSATVQANAGQYPQAVRECQWNGATCTATKSRGLRVIGPGCTTGGPSVKTLFALGSSATKYTFYTHLYGVERPANLFADPRYDVGNFSYILKAYEYQNVANPSYDPTKPLTSVVSGQWFALVVAGDFPGKASRGVAATCDNGNATAGCVANNLLAASTNAIRNYDYYLLEDAGNIAARNAKANWQTSAVSNTGWTHIDKMNVRIQWDPAVLNSNGTLVNDTNCCIGEPYPNRNSSGTNAFNTAGGTPMLTIRNGVNGPNTPFNSRIDVTGSSSSAGQSFANLVGQYVYDYAGGTWPFLGDGLDGAEYTGTDVPADIVAMVVAMKAVGPAGSGATVTISQAINTIVNIAVGNKAAIWSADVTTILQRSNQIGTGVGPYTAGWPSTVPAGAGFTAVAYSTSFAENNTGAARGMYNDGTLGLCIQ